ncbi:phosphatase PAP2 family protein [Croceicoccus sp. F390]|uniref:Phosphatase PAP2 family protein n=1 Tax=Croceicoccus esteveae TaxID=3075597 RepID=A0ABU2ZE56_9SPHN|nr:phosphatase PAP2 family protein [Croceicoccus sp. F390]MDT0574888.1 phosphatase PAP2 family protein [Croceicoccus sp. F390]
MHSTDDATAVPTHGDGKQMLWLSPEHALAFAATFLVGFVALAMLIAHGQTAGFDKAGLLFWRHGDALLPAGPGWVQEMVRDISALGGVTLRNWAAGAGVVALLFLGRRAPALMLAITVASGWLVNTGAKLAFDRARPQIVPHLAEASGASFPSGHSFNGAVVYITLALLFAAISTRRQVRNMLIACAFIVSAAIAMSRVWLGVHYPSDVAAGWMAGAGWAFVCVAVLHRPVQRLTAPTARTLPPAG